jgi:uncharacterized protein YdeI (YjbR/CyaY-like superfamily)
MKTFEAKDRTEWRKWLEKNYSAVAEIQLVYYKKHTGTPSITYTESVEEAICFGWIDGIKKRIDEEKYTHRFTPRKKNSKWSRTNIETAKKMIKAGKMSPMGLRAYNERKEYDAEFLKTRASISENLNPDAERILRTSAKAWKNFSALTPGHRKQYCLWINSAKKDTTRQKRISEAIRLLEQNKKLGMK